MAHLNIPFVAPLLDAVQHGIRGRNADDARIALGDGRSVVVAPVRPQDSEAERAFIGGLSLASRYRRFHFGLRELSPEASRAMTEVDQQHHVAFVARPASKDADAPIVADARYVMRADSADAEFAIAVADDWQGAGLGRSLLRMLAGHARARGVDRLTGDVLWGNQAMLALVRSLGASMMRKPGDATVVRVVLALEGAGTRSGES
jgi:GNAT superfamily N-acetyltransferase